MGLPVNMWCKVSQCGEGSAPMRRKAGPGQSEGSGNSPDIGRSKLGALPTMRRD